MLIFLAALQAIPHDLYEAARIDGANGWQIATKIKLPNVRGAALLAMLNSCASGVSVVNIDNGFGAGYQAHMINHVKARTA